MADDNLIPVTGRVIYAATFRTVVPADDVADAQQKLERRIRATDPMETYRHWGLRFVEMRFDDAGKEEGDAAWRETVRDIYDRLHFKKPGFFSGDPLAKELIAFIEDRHPGYFVEPRKIGDQPGAE